MSKYAEFMKIALEEARLSKQSCNKGYGAVLIKDNKVIAQAHDTVAQTKDSPCHAEMNIVRMASKEFGADLSGCVVVSTCEPCPMCSSASLWANIDKIIYGASIEETKQLGRTRLSQVDFSGFKLQLIQIDDEVLKKECLDLYNY